MNLLIEIAQKHEIVIKIAHKLGAYIVKNQLAFELFQQNVSETFDTEELLLETTFQLDERKTFFQDVEFGIYQIVEIASKTLSPDVNNSYTATNCIDYLTSILCKLTIILEADRGNVHTKVLKNYAKLVMETGDKSFLLQADIDDLEQRYTLFKTAV